MILTSSGSVQSIGALVLSADASAVMLRTGATSSSGSGSISKGESLQQAWAREEALAAITSVDFVDAAGAVGRSVDHHTPSYVERLKLQWEDISASFASALSLVSGKKLH